MKKRVKGLATLVLALGIVLANMIPVAAANIITYDPNPSPVIYAGETITGCGSGYAFLLADENDQIIDTGGGLLFDVL